MELEHTEEDERILQAELNVPSFKCDKCERTFISQPALTMHKIRKHGKGWETGGNFRKRGRTKPHLFPNLRGRERELAMKREYNRRMRNRYYAQGLDSRGKKRPPGWKADGRREGVQSKYGAKWTPERLKRFRKTWRKKRMERASRLPIVYPDLRQNAESKAITEAIRNTWPDDKDITVPALKFCPCCGESLTAWRYQP